LPLKGCRILILEDEHLIASLCSDELKGRGAEIVGPVGDVSEGLSLARREPLDAAILEVLVHGGPAYPVAELLLKRGVPIVFTTGLTAELLPPHWRGTKIFEKPFDVDDLVNHIVFLFQRARSRAAE
jgi:DNA-binding response OmpR family regulator